ncbi:MAG: zinc-binding dehydrogenase [Solirubrobacteraceae bacterium]
MKVVECIDPGLRGTIAVGERPVPVAGPGEVLVRVGGAALNYVDVLLRRGRYAQAPEPPFVLGSEVAGEIVAVGPGVTDRRVGERVMAMTDGTGGLAELAVVPAALCVVLPDGVDAVAGAAFLLTFLTAHVPLTRQVRVGPGSAVLVHAAGGGVGTAAVQLARELGATMILASAGAPERLALARELGATATIDHREEDVVARARELTDGRGVDVVVDPVGGTVTTDSLRALAPLGTVVAIGSAGGAWPSVDPTLLVGRNIAVAGFFLGRLMRLDPAVVAAASDELVGLWAAGRVSPAVGHVLPLDAAEDGLDRLEQRRSSGKVVLRP